MRRTIGALVALALLAGACATSPDAATTSSSSITTVTTTPAESTTVVTTTTTTTEFVKPYGGQVVIGEDQFPQTLNPYAPGGDFFITSVIGQAHLVGVWDIDGATLERIPDVVTELPTIANGGVVVNEEGTMTVRYLIRDEAVWADGVAISGDDFQFTYELLTDDALAIELFDVSDVYRDIVATESDAKTFSLTLATPTIRHENLFRFIVPRHDVEGSDFINDWNDRAWVAGGPFMVERFEPFEAVTLIRNDTYWKTDDGASLPYLDRVEFRFVPETDQLVRAFTSGDIQVIQPPPDLRLIDQLVGLEADGAAISVQPGPIWEHINFQFGPGRLERNPDSMNEYLRFRRAVAHAIDRDAIATDILGGHAGALSSYVEAFTPSLSMGVWDIYDYNPDKARALLESLCGDLGRDCVANPITAVFSTTSNAEIRPKVAAMMQQMLTDVGIDLVVDLEDSALFFGPTLTNGEWDIGMWAWVGSTGLAGLVSIHDVFDPDLVPDDSLTSANYYRWGTSDSVAHNEATVHFADLVDLMAATVDETELRLLIHDAEQTLADQVVIIPLYSRLSVGAVWAGEIGGYVHNRSQASHTWNIEEWYRLDG